MFSHKLEDQTYQITEVLTRSDSKSEDYAEFSQKANLDISINLWKIHIIETHEQAYDFYKTVYQDQNSCNLKKIEENSQFLNLKTVKLSDSDFDMNGELVIGVDCEGLTRAKNLSLIQVREPQNFNF